MLVKLIHLDGSLPNLALMKLAHWHRAQGHQVSLTRRIQPRLGEPAPDLVYASAIFEKSAPRIAETRAAWPGAIIGGTGTDDTMTVEETIGVPRYERHDYSAYPTYPWSIGLSMRGCRLRCRFCKVPVKEGRPVFNATIEQIWRPGTPRNIVLLDNDFFGQQERDWRARTEELRRGNFKVSFSQGINIRMITQETAEELASLELRDNEFQRRRLYTAWDNLKDEDTFFRGVDLLENAGIPPRQLMVYMLVGYAEGETIQQVMHRYARIRDRGALPFPMVYDRSNRALCAFQRWVIKRYHQFVPWRQYSGNPSRESGRRAKPDPRQLALPGLPGPDGAATAGTEQCAA